MTGIAWNDRRAHVLAIVLAGLIAYGNCYDGKFVSDDFTSIVRNPSVRQLWPPWAGMTAPLETTTAGRPFAAYVCTLNYAACGLELGGWHAVNVGIHLACALLLYAWIRRFLELPRWNGAWSGAAPGLAFVTVLIWTVHPLNTDAVTYIVQRAEALVSLCFVLTCYAALRSEASPHPWRWKLLAVVACTAGMASKENMVGAPIVVFLQDVVTTHGTVARAWRARRGFYAALASTWLLLAALVASAPRPTTTGFGCDVPGWWAYAYSEGGVILDYLALAFRAFPLTFYYEMAVAQTWTEIVPHCCAVLGLVAITVWGVVRKPAWGFWGALFFVVLAPTSSVMPIVDLKVEHRMYLPLVSVLLLTVLAVHHALDWLRTGARISAATERFLRCSLPVLAAAALVVLTWYRNVVYYDPIELWRGRQGGTPGTPAYYHKNGLILSRRGRLEEALPLFQRAAELYWYRSAPYFNFGGALYQAGRLDEAEAEVGLALNKVPERQYGWHLMALLHAARGRFDPARTCFQEAIRIQPHHVESHFGLAQLFEAEGREADAVRHYRAADLPSDLRSRVRTRLARLHLMARDPQVRDPEAGTRLAEEICRQPDATPEAYDLLALGRALQKRWAEAAEAARLGEAAAYARKNRALAEELSLRRQRYLDLAAQVK